MIICPIMSKPMAGIHSEAVAYLFEVKCKREECAWWYQRTSDAGYCAVVRIARVP